MTGPSQSSGSFEVSPLDLYERIRTGEPVTILDNRERDAYDAWHISGDSVTSVHVDYDRVMKASVKGEAADLVTDLVEPIIAVCGKGITSADVAEALRDEGVDAVNLADGMRGWARVYVAEEISDVGADATVLQYQRPSSGCLGYMVVSGDEAAVIDPLRVFADRYVTDARERGATIEYAIDTHVHADHVSGVREVATRCDAEVVLPAGAKERGLAFDAHLLKDRDELLVGNAFVRAMHTPGHTSELTSYRVGDLAFTGDTLFLESVGRPDLETGADGAADAAAQLYDTLHERMLELPAATVVAPGHFGEHVDPGEDGTYTAPLAAVKSNVHALSLERDAFVEYVVGNMPPQPANFEEIIATNLGRSTADDDEAFELELGPNNCAATTIAE